MDEELYVVISRSPSDYICGEVPISEIEGVMWDNISGGVKKGQSGYSLYGYISYKLATETVKCSGRHDFGDNSAKICIPKAKNRDAKHKKGYDKLSKLAGDKPACTIKKNRPKDGPPCTKRILVELENTDQITRKILRDTLISEGYPITAIRNAIYSLRKHSKIEVEGSPNSPKQIIRKA